MKNEGFFHGDFRISWISWDFHGFMVQIFFSDLDGDSIRDLLLRCSKPGDFSRWV